jgi:integrase
LLVDRLGISKLSFHALRHTFATRALESGMDVKTLSEILGHKSATVTLNLYAHSMMDHKRGAMDKLGRLFSQ